MPTLFDVHLLRHIALARVIQETLELEVDRAAGLLITALQTGHKILLCGNGGSAADAQRIAAELTGRYEIAHRRVLPVLALTTDFPAVTAIGSDFGFDRVFARQVEAHGQLGDVLIGISTSGQSPNIIAAVDQARRQGLKTVGLLGHDGGDLVSRVDAPIIIPSQSTPHIQEMHVIIGHCLCAMVDAAFGNKLSQELWPLDHALMDEPQLLAAVETARANGQRIVMTNGCFDVLHAGHVGYLNQARALGDRLIVAVNDDASVRRLKGSGRPINSVERRMAVLAGLRAVDWVIPFAEDTPERLICAVRPQVLVKGGDYRPEQVAGRECVEGAGGRLVILPFLDGCSTTAMLDQIRGAEADVRLES